MNMTANQKDVDYENTEHNLCLRLLVMAVSCCACMLCRSSVPLDSPPGRAGIFPTNRDS